MRPVVVAVALAAMGCSAEPPAPAMVSYLTPTEHLACASLVLRGIRPSARRPAIHAPPPRTRCSAATPKPSAERARQTRGATGYNRRRVDDCADAIARSERLKQLRDQFGARGEAMAKNPGGSARPHALHSAEPWTDRDDPVAGA